MFIRRPRLSNLPIRRHLLKHQRPISQVHSVIPGTHSIVSGPSDPPLSELTLPEYYKTQILPHHASRPAVISRHEHNVRWNFAEFDEQIERMARGLVGAGVKRGDRVATILGNCSAYAVLQWACARIGAIIVTMNPAYKPHEILAALNAVSASTLILTPTLRKSNLLDSIISVLPSLSSTPAGKDISDPALPSLRRLFVVDNTGDLTGASLRAEMNKVPVAVNLADVSSARYGTPPETASDPNEVINLQFTRQVPIAELDLQGSVLGNLAAWVHGAAIVYASESFDPKAIVRAVSDERCTALHGVPTHFIGVLDELDRLGPDSGVDMGSLRTGIAAGSPVPIDLMKQLISRLNLRDLTIAYGMTETSPVTFQTTPDDRLEMRVESVGRVQPHVQAKIIDEHGSIVPIGIRGELCIAGYTLQKGYWNDPEQTKDVMKRNAQGTLWMHTGDQAVMDQEGYLKITGRIKDLIIRGGENLSPVQIENCLTSHPDIVEAAAIAVPDARYGEAVGVWVVPHPGHPSASSLSRQDVVEWVKSNMNPQNAPSKVWFIGEDDIPVELPKTASGKIMKNTLRDWAKSELAKGEITRLRSKAPQQALPLKFL